MHNWFRFISKIRMAVKIILDVIIAFVSIHVTYLLRYDGLVPPTYLNQLELLLPIVISITVIAGLVFGTYRQLWQYSSVFEGLSLIAISGTVVSFLFGLRISGLILIPYSIILIYGLLPLFLQASLRIARLIQFHWFKNLQNRKEFKEALRTVFIGAGDTTNGLLSDIRFKKFKRWEVVGLLDDDPSKNGVNLHGYKIFGPTTALEQIIEQHDIQLVVISMPSAKSSVIKDILRRSINKNVQVKVIPPLDEKYENYYHKNNKGRITLNDLKDAKEIKDSALLNISTSKKEKSVLITGGAGYIGAHLVCLFLKEGYNVTVLDKFLYGDIGIRNIVHEPNLTIIEGDIANIKDVTSVVKNVSIVVALAALVGDPACGLDAEETLNLNYESTKIILEACEFYNVERLVFASSCSVYGASDDKILVEESPINPVSLYARTRIYSEEYILNNSQNITPVILRLSTIFGLSPRMRYDLVINTLVAKGVVDGKFNVFGGNQWRPFVHCKDAANAFYLAAIKDSSIVSGQIFNVGRNELNYTISQIAELISEELHDVKISYDDNVNDPRNYRVSFDKIKNSLGFSPQYDVRQGIQEMIEEIRKNPHLKDINNPVFSNVAYLKSQVSK